MQKRFGWGVAALALIAATHAQARADRTTLPIPAPAFDGVIAENVVAAKPETPHRVTAPAGAPNVLVFLSDDVGFAMTSAFGGPVPTPNFERLAARGQRYNRFHTIGVCSPTRAALLTGRNHHNANMGHVSDLAAGFPGYRGYIPRETATIAQTLRLNGYNTAMFGKHHNVPPGEDSAAGPFDNWPSGLGFEYFFGIVTADSDQFNPNLYRGVYRVDPKEAGGRMLEQRLADEIIDWTRNQQAAAPDKPFFIYYAPGSTHAPHQAPQEYLARFRGQFDQGWDRMRETIYRRQLAQGVIPKGTRLTARPDRIPAWDTLNPAEKAFAARSMEAAAAQLAYQDAQMGRVLDELERMGELDNTLIVTIAGDNGASLEAGPRGTINEIGRLSGGGEDPAWMLANTDKLGGPLTYGNYPSGWAWAMNTPYRWGKMYASVLGSVRNGMVMTWKGHVPQPGKVCARFGHVIDVAPTILEAAGLPAPNTVLGAKQKPIDGQSLLSSLANCQPDAPRTQYFEVGGKIALYHDGWLAANDDDRVTWEDLPPSGVKPQTQWSLYNLSQDFSQDVDLAAKNPEKLQELTALWRREAERNAVYPLDHRFGMARAASRRASESAGRKQFDFWGKGVSTPGNGAPGWAGRSFTLDADLELPRGDASGVVVALGSRFGGWSLYLDKGKPRFVYAGSTNPADALTLSPAAALPAGKSTVRLRVTTAGFGKPAEVVLSNGSTELARGTATKTFMTPAGLGETFDIGRDIGVSVTDYPAPGGAIEGEIPHVRVSFD